MKIIVDSAPFESSAQKLKGLDIRHLANLPSFVDLYVIDDLTEDGREVGDHELVPIAEGVTFYSLPKEP